MAIIIDSNFVPTAYVIGKANLLESQNRAVREMGNGTYMCASYNGEKIYETTIVPMTSGGYETTCDCEAGKPTHEGQEEKFCCHRLRVLRIVVGKEIAAKQAQLGRLS